MRKLLGLAVAAMIAAMLLPGAAGATSSSTSNRDLYFVKDQATGTGMVELHSATAASGYSQAGQHNVTGFELSFRGSCRWKVVQKDLYCIFVNPEVFRMVFVMVATASSNYKDVLSYGTWFSAAEQFNGQFEMVGRDLYFVKTNNGGVNLPRVEVHNATAASGYKGTSVQKQTWMTPPLYDRWNLPGRDLYGVDTAGGAVRLSRATVASDYQQGSRVNTWFGAGDFHNGVWQMAGPDLYFVKTLYTGSGRIEVHNATAASGYKATSVQRASWFRTYDAGNGSWLIGS